MMRRDNNPRKFPKPPHVFQTFARTRERRAEVSIMSERAARRLLNLIAATILCACFYASPLRAQTRQTRARTTTEQSTSKPSTPARDSSAQPPAQSQSVPEENADLAIIANVQAKELKFEVVPNPNVEFPGRPARATEWSAERTNLPPQVQPGVTYRDIGIRLKIVSLFPDIDRIVAEALGEVPQTDDSTPLTTSPPSTSQPSATHHAGSMKYIDVAAKRRVHTRATRRLK
jgi:hypothetical protein